MLSLVGMQETKDTEIRSVACAPNLFHFGLKQSPVSRTVSKHTILTKHANWISGCWTNALQPLWLAGKAMSHHSEHSAIVDTLTRIERETGWATTWRVEDLKEFWGDDD